MENKEDTLSDKRITEVRMLKGEKQCRYIYPEEEVKEFIEKILGRWNYDDAYFGKDFIEFVKSEAGKELGGSNG